MMAAPQTPNAFTDFINVLVVIGLPRVLSTVR